MRSLRKSWIGIVLVFFFGISLFFWKQSTVVSNIFNSDTVIAKVGDTKISTTRFNRGLQLNIKQFKLYAISQFFFFLYLKFKLYLFL